MSQVFLFSLTASAAQAPAACPVAMQVACLRNAEFAMRSLAIILPAASILLLPAGISAPRGTVGLRIQATCMATGQASGALAALCVRHSAHPLELPNDLLRNELAKHGAILPPA